MNSRLANLFILGYPKCGTTALWQYLVQHPLIQPATLPNGKPVKEPYTLVEKIAMDRLLECKVRSRDDCFYLYSQLFLPNKATYRIDASPDYIYFPGIPKLLQTIDKGCKVIVCLRNPATYILSLHKQWIRMGLDIPLGLESNGRNISGIPFEWRTQYCNQMKRIKEFIEPDRMLVVLHEDFVRNTSQVLEEVFSFLALGLPELHKPKIQFKEVSIDVYDTYFDEAKEKFHKEVSGLENVLNMDLLEKWGIAS